MVDRARDGEEAWFLGDTEDFDLVVLDLGLPKLDGAQVLKRWRANGRTMPVLILTARDAWSEKVDGIDAGADDYLVKPFRMEELMARVRALLRRLDETCQRRADHRTMWRSTPACRACCWAACRWTCRPWNTGCCITSCTMRAAPCRRSS